MVYSLRLLVQHGVLVLTTLTGITARSCVSMGWQAPIAAFFAFLRWPRGARGGGFLLQYAWKVGTTAAIPYGCVVPVHLTSRAAGVGAGATPTTPAQASRGADRSASIGHDGRYDLGGRDAARRSALPASAVCEIGFRQISYLFLLVCAR